MTKAQKGELAVFVVIAATAGVLVWLHSRQTYTAAPAADPTLYGMGTGGSGSVAPVSLGDVPAVAFANPGPAQITYNLGGSNFSVGGHGCGCNTCGGANSTGLTFGSSDALAAYMVASGQAIYGSDGTLSYV